MPVASTQELREGKPKISIALFSAILQERCIAL